MLQDNSFIDKMRRFYYQLDEMDRDIIIHLKDRENFPDKPPYLELIEEIRREAIPKLIMPNQDQKYWANRILDKARTMEISWKGMFERDEEECLKAIEANKQSSHTKDS